MTKVLMALPADFDRELGGLDQTQVRSWRDRYGPAVEESLRMLHAALLQRAQWFSFSAAAPSRLRKQEERGIRT